MAIYYVDFVNGLDANNGLGPDASAGTNKPWKTITKLLGAAGMASGDTAYLSPAGPFRETISAAMTSATAETKVLGDHANVQGFKTSGGVPVAPGPIQVTAYTTNDKTAPSGTTLLNLNGKSFLTFQFIQFVGGNAVTVTATTATSHDIKFLDCAFTPGGTISNPLMTTTTPFNTALNWTLDRCIFIKGVSPGFNFVLTTGVGADYDANVLIQNSLFAGSLGSWVQVTNSGASANRGGGVRIKNCTTLVPGALINVANANVSTTIPCDVSNCFIFASTTAGMIATTLGQVTENYNIISGTVPRTNVNVGANSISDGSYASLLHFGQERIWGMIQRHLGEPMAASPLLAFGNDGTQTSYDNRNNPRPAGGASPNPSVGAFERSNTWGKETSTVQTGSNALSITGPGYQDFIVPVSAASTTVSVYMRFDGTYAGTKPTVSVLNGSECGVTDATSSAVTTVDTWENLSLTFTPSSSGIVTIRLNSTDTNGGGKAFADDFAVA